LKYVRDQLVLVSALITKRSLFDNRFDDSDTVLLHITQLINMEAKNAVKQLEKISNENEVFNCLLLASTWSCIS
jgi:hypothetical protein